MTTPTSQLAGPSRGPSGHRPVWLGPALVVLGAGLAVNSVLGPLVADAIDYPVSETLRNQTIGLDAAGLVIVAPLAVLAGVLARRDHVLAPVLGLVVGAYTAYTFVQYILGPEYVHYPGALPLQLGLFILGWVVALGAWGGTATVWPPPMGPRTRAGHAAVLFAFAAFVVVRYLPGLGAALAGDPIPEETLQDPSMFWTILLMDLGVFVPAAVVTAVGLIQGDRWAHRALYGVAGWFLLVTAAVTAMAVTMAVNDDPYASGGQAIAFAALGVVVLVYAGYLFRPLVALPAGATGTAGRAGPGERAGPTRRATPRTES